MEIIFKRAYSRAKKLHIDKNVFALYAPRGVNIEPATSYKIDTEIIVLLPNNSSGLVTSKFRGDEIHKFNAKKERLWVEILLNKSYEDNLILKKDSIIRFVVIEPEHLPHKHATKILKKKAKKDKISKKTSDNRAKTQTSIQRFFKQVCLCLRRDRRS